MKVLHSWLKDYIGPDIPDAGTIEKLLTFHAFEVDGMENVDDTTCIDVKILPDRSSDCLSHRGIAYEIATCRGIPLVYDPLREPTPTFLETSALNVSLSALDASTRYMGAILKDVRVGPSPEWLVSRLTALGQRSINNVVDITNYVMLALGQPLHAYDASKLTARDGVWHIDVRPAREGESCVILGGETVELPLGATIIADGHTDTPLGIAGIKGGKSSEITHETTTVILEAAHFSGKTTRRTAQRIRLQTDASKRFENNLSPTIAPYALQLCIRMIEEYAGGLFVGVAEARGEEDKHVPVTVTRAHITALLGMDIPTETISSILARVAPDVTYENDAWTVTPPHERTDILIPEDLIAEVGRIHGYEHVASIIPESAPLAEINQLFCYTEKIRSFLVDRGFSEVITSSFRDEDTIRLKNALASDKGCVRSDLAQGIQTVLSKNSTYMDLLGLSSLRVFEIGTVFQKNTESNDVREKYMLACGVRTKVSGYSPADDREVASCARGVCEYLGAQGGEVVEIKNGVWEIDLTLLMRELPVVQKYDTIPPAPEIKFAPYSLFPHMSRDIALWVPSDTTPQKIGDMIKREAGELLVRVTLFDTFEKDDRVSYAFRLIFQSHDRTLTDEEILEVMERINVVLVAEGYLIR